MNIRDIAPMTREKVSAPPAQPMAHPIHMMKRRKSKKAMKFQPKSPAARPPMGRPMSPMMDYDNDGM